MLKLLTTSAYRFHPDTEAIGTVSFAEDPVVLQAEATLLTAAATDRQMAQELDRATQLRATNGVSERELEQARSDAATARSELSYLLAARHWRWVRLASSWMSLLGQVGLPSLSSGRSKWVSLNVTELDSSHFRPGMRLRIVTSDIPNHVFLAGS